MPRTSSFAPVLFLLVGLVGWPASSAAAIRLQTAAPGPGARCDVTAAAARDGRPLLEAAQAAMGTDRLHGAILEVRSTMRTVQDYQSDRSYPPFLDLFEQETRWFDPGSGAERRRFQTTFPGAPDRAVEFLSTARSTWFVRDTLLRPFAALHPTTVRLRALNPWAVVEDWLRAEGAQAIGTCGYRDYPRLVLERPDRPTQRLLLDPRTGVPVALLEEQAHYLWGQVTAEYVWSTWMRVGEARYPVASFEVTDGATTISRTVGAMALLPADSAPSLAVPDTAVAMDPGATPQFMRPDEPDTVRVGPATFLLRNTGYTEAVSLIGDTVFVFDATQGEERARADSAWIGRLFPGRHPVVLVVTDLAWPHIAGVRFWVASGATIVSHRVSQPFLEQVVARRWTRTPDALERTRRPMAFRAIDRDTPLAGGAVSVHPIDGAASEGALVAWLPGDRFLWAGDYVQDLSQPTEYAEEVIAAVRRVGVAPERFAAQHVGLTDWERVTAAHPARTEDGRRE